MTPLLAVKEMRKSYGAIRAVDGVSLTVVEVDDEGLSFTIAFIPHTLEETVAGGYEMGTEVNLEVDVVSRYLERLVRPSTKPGIK